MTNGGVKKNGNGPNNRDTLHIKLILSGDANAGKTCLILRYVDRKFNEYTVPTIGGGFFKKTINVGDVEVFYEIWDTAGQERYDSLATLYYRGAHAAIIVYDITSFV